MRSERGGIIFAEQPAETNEQFGLRLCKSRTSYPLLGEGERPTGAKVQCPLELSSSISMIKK
ncbi:TPA: hypothetical protein DIC20_04715 [Candidatus Dependentiae bacterium]|nr:hypothetical protein [Candidatus Dependentiae bacterium]